LADCRWRRWISKWPRSWNGILPHLTWQANVKFADGSTHLVTQQAWTEDPASAGQEYLRIYLKQP
jgi:hypothetical protein